MSNKTCLIVIGGNTYSIRNTLKELGFRAKKANNTWFQYRSVLEDKFNHWKNALEEKDSRLFVFKLEDMGWQNLERQLVGLIPILKEAQELENEVNPPVELKGESIKAFIEVKKWYANIVKDELGIGFMFRNWKVNKIYRETPRAVLVDAEAYGGVLTSCGICGRKLDNKISKATGIGPICAEKIGLERPTMENAELIVKELENKMKEIKPLKMKWIPKSQIIRGLDNLEGRLDNA